jgi:CRP-like cAMP-binding protein
LVWHVKGVQLPGAVRRLISLLVGFITLLAVLRFRFDVRADDLAIIIAVAAVIGALFLQGLVRDLFLGISMALQKRIRVGDWVAIDGHAGQVVAVDWNTTTLRNPRGEHTVIPNRRVAEGIVTQSGHGTQRCQTMAISIPADAAPSIVIAELAATIAEAPDVLREPAPNILYLGEQAGEARYRASFWLPRRLDGEAAQSELRVAIWYRLRRRGLVPRHGSFEPDSEQVADALRNLPFLAAATPAQIEILAKSVRTVRYGKGEVLFRQGDRTDELFLIHSGFLDISVINGGRVEEKIASVGAGSFVGERSLLTGEPRSATARVAQDCILFVVDKEAMGELLWEHPTLAHEIAQVMAARDQQRHQLTNDRSNDESNAAKSLLVRIRDFFALQ